VLLPGALSVLFSTRNRLQPVQAPTKAEAAVAFSPLLNEEQTATGHSSAGLPGGVSAAFQSSSQRGTDCNHSPRDQIPARAHYLSVLFSTRNRLQLGSGVSGVPPLVDFQSSSQRGTDCNRLRLSPGLLAAKDLSVLFSTRNRLQRTTSAVSSRHRKCAFQSSSQRGTDCNHQFAGLIRADDSAFSPLLNEEQTATGPSRSLDAARGRGLSVLFSTRNRLQLLN